MLDFLQLQVKIGFGGQLGLILAPLLGGLGVKIGYRGLRYRDVGPRRVQAGPSRGKLGQLGRGPEKQKVGFRLGGVAFFRCSATSG